MFTQVSVQVRWPHSCDYIAYKVAKPRKANIQAFASDTKPEYSVVIGFFNRIGSHINH